MTLHTKPISPLRKRMLEDMALRKLAPKTQSNYLRAVINFTCFLGRSPDTATAEDLRRYQLHLVETGTSSIMLNSTITALRFFFGVTLDRAEVVAKMSSVREPHKLPVVLSREEVARLIEAAGTPKYQAALSVAYGAGLRASEVVSLKVGDIDSNRMTLRVEQGKGRKDRYATLSPLLLETEERVQTKPSAAPYLVQGVVQIGITDSRVKQALFVVLLGADMPSCLLEAGFVTSARDRKLVSSVHGVRAMGAAVVRAVEQFRRDEGTESARQELGRCLVSEQ